MLSKSNFKDAREAGTNLVQAMVDPVEYSAIFLAVSLSGLEARGLGGINCLDTRIVYTLRSIKA